ncbi:MAG: hypothetical protein IMZ62_12900 [Chloroflexi bacterium]|nr:hypothetical protein [Chloroflexota bacterium]MBE3119102.1 hypothetical protein [Candidatus Atribacteria bacterium]
MPPTSRELAALCRNDPQRQAALAAQTRTRAPSGRTEPLAIRLPLPPKILHPNHHVASRAGRMAQARATAAYRTATCACAMEAIGRCLPPMWARAKLTYTFFLLRDQDADNLNGWMKAGQDGLADAGLVPNDKCFVPQPPGKVIVKEKPGVTVTVEPLEGK